MGIRANVFAVNFFFLSIPPYHCLLGGTSVRLHRAHAMCEYNIYIYKCVCVYEMYQMYEVLDRKESIYTNVQWTFHVYVEYMLVWMVVCPRRCVRCLCYICWCCSCFYGLLSSIFAFFSIFRLSSFFALSDLLSLVATEWVFSISQFGIFLRDFSLGRFSFCFCFSKLLQSFRSKNETPEIWKRNNKIQHSFLPYAFFRDAFSNLFPFIRWHFLKYYKYSLQLMFYWWETITIDAAIFSSFTLSERDRIDNNLCIYTISRWRNSKVYVKHYSLRFKTVSRFSNHDSIRCNSIPFHFIRFHFHSIENHNLSTPICYCKS